MLAKVLSAAVIGLEAVPIEVEVDIASQGLPSFTIVGLPDKAVEEAKERVRSAIRNSGADFPARRITVNLAPADLPKEGPSYDLPIALGILIASGQLQVDLSTSLVIGELSLDGRIRSVPGVLPQVLMARVEKLFQIVVPKENEKEAAIIDDVLIYAASTLLELFHHLSRQTVLLPVTHISLHELEKEMVFEFDMSDIRGQEQAKRAFEIAAAGSHNLLMKGSPGAGKTLLARTLPSILPSLTIDEAIEVTKIYSIAGLLGNQMIKRERPFRSPHHTTSLVGLIGGSSHPKPGEVTLAHRGVLFLDEFPEFPRSVLEALRQPLEDGFVSISRASGKLTFPARCMLIAAQNPCPCGYLGDKTKTCICTQSQITRYQKKVSGPLLDRIDIHLTVPAIKVEKLTERGEERVAESSESIRKRVQEARERQIKRYIGSSITANADLTNKSLQKYCILSADCLTLLKQAVQKFQLSGRAYHRVIKLSRTIADLSESEEIAPEHIAEALQYRPKETERLY